MSCSVTIIYILLLYSHVLAHILSSLSLPKAEVPDCGPSATMLESLLGFWVFFLNKISVGQA